jgi:hypothetical protein
MDRWRRTAARASDSGVHAEFVNGAARVTLDGSYGGPHDSVERAEGASQLFRVLGEQEALCTGDRAQARIPANWRAPVLFFQQSYCAICNLLDIPVRPPPVSQGDRCMAGQPARRRVRP